MIKLIVISFPSRCIKTIGGDKEVTCGDLLTMAMNSTTALDCSTVRNTSFHRGNPAEIILEREAKENFGALPERNDINFERQSQRTG